MDNLPEDPYDILGIDEDATQTEIRKSYRILLWKTHPDRSPDPIERAKRRPEFERVQWAYEILSDEHARREYDRMVRAEELREQLMKRSKPESTSGYFESISANTLSWNTTLPARGSLSDRVYSIAFDSEKRRIEKDINERNERARKYLTENVGNDAPWEKQQEDPGQTRVDKLKTLSTEKDKKLSSVPATQLGLRVMNPGLVDAAVDIVAVHGLGAIPEITWKDSKSGVNWLSDPQMLPSLTPEARILRFGYDSLWLGKEAIRTRLPTIADKLLLVLAREREEDPMRPLIFIGHCFGGLVIQRALITAKLYPESEIEEAILSSAVGAVFLGTPHRGTGAFSSQSALLAAIAAQSELYPSMEAGVLDAMKAERGELLDVSEDFLKLSARAKMRITCFFEQRESNLGKMIGRDDIKQFFVDETSAKLGANRAIGLATDHFRLNKFAAAEDGNYLDVAGEVARFYTEALKLANDRRSSRRKSSGDLEQYRRLVAKQELKLEEAAKEAALKEEEFEKRFQEKLASELNSLSLKEDATKRKEHVERLKRNMRRYGLGKHTVRKIFQDNPPPSIESISQDEIEESDQWYQNSLKGSLLEAGLEEGEVDAIIHDTGETMVIEGVRTSITRMSDRWLSERTLRRYDIPYMQDPEKPSTLIIKRWVPLYEKEFLWDHTQELKWKRQNVESSRLSGTVEASKSPFFPSFRRNQSSESIRSNTDRESILRRRRASAESILSPPSSETVAHRRNSSRTLQEQNRSRRSSTDSAARKPTGSRNYMRTDTEQAREEALRDRGEERRELRRLEQAENKRRERDLEAQTAKERGRVKEREVRRRRGLAREAERESDINTRGAAHLDEGESVGRSHSESFIQAWRFLGRKKRGQSPAPNW